MQQSIGSCENIHGNTVDEAKNRVGAILISLSRLPPHILMIISTIISIIWIHHSVTLGATVFNFSDSVIWYSLAFSPFFLFLRIAS